MLSAILFRKEEPQTFLQGDAIFLVNVSLSTTFEPVKMVVTPKELMQYFCTCWIKAESLPFGHIFIAFFFKKQTKTLS